MTKLNENEKKAILILFKDIYSYHNANSLSKIIGISRVGVMKMLKKLKKDELIISKNIGKSTVYKLNFSNDFASDVLIFLLVDEANKFRRWKDEFKEIFNQDRIVLLFGSTIMDYSKAKDIDLMVISKKEDSGDINSKINERQKIIPKKIHLIDLSPAELIKNIKEKQEAIVDIIKTAIVLNGQDRYVGIIKNVSSI